LVNYKVFIISSTPLATRDCEHIKQLKLNVYSYISSTPAVTHTFWISGTVIMSCFVPPWLGHQTLFCEWTTRRWDWY